MRIDHNPIHRKVIVPWYDSEAACVMIIVFMVLVLLFGITGIFVSREMELYRNSGWVAVLLTGLSGCVLVSTSLRLVFRHLKRYS
jgi:hypothetical protein